MRSASLPRLPWPLQKAMALLPPAPVKPVVERLAQAVAARHPQLFARLGPHAAKTFLIEPTDLPFAFRLNAAGPAPEVEPLRRADLAKAPPGTFDARIAGPLAALLGMIHSTFDGDALFFSGDLVIEGDTEAVLALRNTLDDAELDLADEFAAAAGPLGPMLRALRPHLLPPAERLTGLCLTRTA